MVDFERSHMDRHRIRRFGQRVRYRQSERVGEQWCGAHRDGDDCRTALHGVAGRGANVSSGANAASTITIAIAGSATAGAATGSETG